MDCSPSGSSVHGIFPARILEWVAISSSRDSSQPRDRTQVSCSSCITGGFFFFQPLSYQGSPIRCYGNILKIFTYQSKVAPIKIKIIKVNQMPCGKKKKIKLKNNWDLSKSMTSSMNHNWKSKLKLYKSDV